MSPRSTLHVFVPPLGLVVAALLLVSGLTVVAAPTAHAAGAPLLAPAAADRLGHFVPTYPSRMLDTDVSFRRLVRAGETVTLTLAGTSAVPLHGVSAVALTVTVARASKPGYVTAYPAGQRRPGTASVSVQRYKTRTGSVVVKLGTGGAVALTMSGTPARVLVDVTGWYTAGSQQVAGALTPITPSRLVDTRSDTLRSRRPLASGEVLRVLVAGRGGLPRTGLSAVAVSLTVPATSRPGHLVAWSGVGGVPGASALNYATRETTTNTAIVPVAPDGTIAVRNAGGPAALVLDLLGWSADGPRDPGALTAVTTSRLYDTRRSGVLREGQSVTLPVLGRSAIPTSGVSAVVLNVTATGARAAGNLTAHSADVPTPYSTSARYGTGESIATQVVVPVGRGGTIRLRNAGGPTHALIDVQGWYTAEPVQPFTPLTPPVADRLAAGALTSADGQRAARVLLTTNRYALRRWWPSVSPDLLRQVGGRVTGAMPSDPLRRLGMEALGLAVSLRTGAYDPAVTGVPAAEAREIAITLVDAVAATHIANRVGGWGAGSQGALWSSQALRAGWLLWEDLPPLTQSRLARMLEREADTSMAMRPVYLRDEEGTVVRQGNSGAEENSWWSLPLQLATATMPGHPHWAAWRHAQVQLMLAAWAQPKDATSDTVVNGRSLSDWLDGSNVEADGLVVNHSRVAPDYATNLYQNVDGILVDALAGTASPEATRRGLDVVYAATSTVQFDPKKFAAPGGLIYQRGTTPVYYPQGCDWGTGQALPYALVDAQSAAFGFGLSQSSTFESQHVGQQLALQARHSDGSTFDSTTEYKYRGREEHTAQLAAQLYWTKVVRDRGLATFTDADFWSPAPGAETATANSRTAPTVDESMLVAG